MSEAKNTSSYEESGMSDAIAGFIPEGPNQPKVIYRFAGSDYLLLEYGELVLDLTYRFRIYTLEQTLIEMNIEGITELAPGVRSILIRYDSKKLSINKLLFILRTVEKTLPPTESIEIPSRIVYLPIACHDPWTKEAVNKYMKSVRPEAPYLPDNVEFIARCNGLQGVDMAIDYFVSTEHLVVGLGDVYLGAPCAVPLDPRKRLVVPKYNPARMWTPEGAVGIGGAFMCIYPMESPGGYQLIGRTLPIWNTWQTTPVFAESPWLLRPFDRVKFQLVDEEELIEARQALTLGKYQIKIEDGVFKVQEYDEFLKSVQKEVEVFKKQQEKAAEEWTVGY